MPIIQGGEEKISRGAMVTTTGYNCYSDGTVNNPNMQTSQFQQGFHESTNPAEIYNLTTGMDQMIGGFSSSKNITTANLQHTNSVIWKEFFGKSAVSNHNLHHHHHQVDAASSSKTNNGQFHQQDFSTGISDMVRQDHHQSSSAAWHHHDINRSSSVLVDDPSLRVVFPCEGNERPSQGLSLSLGSSNNPSAIGLQSFELRLPHDDMRNDGQFFGKVSLNIQQQQQQEQMMQDGFLGKVANLHHQGQQFHMRNSKYLAPAQELLSEFCNLGTKQIDSTSKLKLHKTNQWLQDDQDNNASSSSKMQSLYSLDLLELQKRKAKLLQMLEEVDRRYKHYCNQMKAVVSSFEAAAGNGAATVYSALASKAMSRHFRCLRDGIVGQIKATKKALGEKDTSIPGATKGETPRLKILDQALRQQKAFQQTNMMESHPWRPQRGLPERAVSVLRAWLFEHFLYPYPSDVDKHVLARQTGLSRSQVSNWFINARVRLWKPMVEEMYTQETKEEEEADDTNIDGGISSAKGGLDDHHDQDQKPTPDKLARIDSECLSSIINNNPPEKNHNMQHNIQQHSFGRVSDSFGAMELDFSSYNHQSYAGGGGGSGGGGVSLTLGLQQHIGGGGGGSGVSLAFSSPSQSSLFYTREHIEDCQQVEYSLLDSDQGQNLPYRDLMGAQLLHDLVG